MALNVPEEEKPKFNKNVQSGLNLFAKDIQRTLGQLEVLQPETIVEAYNKPVQAPVLPDLTPLERYAYAEQPQQEVADIATPPARESMAVPQEDPNLFPEFANQAQAQFSRDAVSITPYEQAVTDIVGAEVDSLRNDAGEIAKSPLEVFSKPLNANSVRALGLVDQDGNPTERGQLFYNLQQSGVFNEDGTINEKGQAYLTPIDDMINPEWFNQPGNKEKFDLLWEDGVIRSSSTPGEIVSGVTKFIGDAAYGAAELTQQQAMGLAYNSRTWGGLLGMEDSRPDYLKARGDVTELSVAENMYKNVIQTSNLIDVGLAGDKQFIDESIMSPLYGALEKITGIQRPQPQEVDQSNANIKNSKDALVAARYNQWATDQRLADMEAGQIAETIFGIDDSVKKAEAAKQKLGAEEFNKVYGRVGAFTNIAGDPTNAVPAAFAVKASRAVPFASRAMLNAQKTMGNIAAMDLAIAQGNTAVQASRAALAKAEPTINLAQRMSVNFAEGAKTQPALLERSAKASQIAQRVTAEANQIKSTLPTITAELDNLVAKRNSLATRIPEEYSKKVLQTMELGRQVRSMPAKAVGATLERVGDTISKTDTAVTNFLQERGLDQMYTAAVGAAGVVGLAGNPIIGTIGAGAAALKTGKVLSNYGKLFRYVGKEMENVRGQIPFWKRVAAHTAPGSLGRGIAHAFNMLDLGGVTSDTIRRAGRGIAAAAPTDLMFEYLSDGADMRPETLYQAGAESFFIGGSFAGAGGAFMGTKKRMRELSIGDELNFRRDLADPRQKALFEAIPAGTRRAISTYAIANPTLNYTFKDSGASRYDPNTNTAVINVNSTNPIKALVAHETLHHTVIKNNMEPGISALFLGDTKNNTVGGLFRSRDGKLDPNFEAFRDGYYKRLGVEGMSNAERDAIYPLDKIAVEYFIEKHADQYAAMAESGELGAVAASGAARRKLGSILETVLPRIPVLKDLHFKSGGMIDKNGAWVTGNGILDAEGVKRDPITSKMFRDMNRRSAGLVPGQFDPLMSDKPDSGAPILLNPADGIDAELLHPLVKVDDTGKPIMQDGKPVALDRATELSRALAGLTAKEVLQRKRDENYAPEKGEAYVDDEGQFQPGWLSNDVLTEMFAKNNYNPEQKRIIREMNKLIRKGAGDRVVMINFPATTRNKAGKVVYKPQGATLRDTVPVAVTISKDGNLLFGLMSVTKLHENIQKRSQDRRGKKLYGGNVDLILRDTQAMMDYHKQGVDSIEFFKQKYGAVEADERKKFINTMFGLLNQKEQAVLNPILLEDGVKSRDNVYRTYRADRVSKAVPMSPDEYPAMPFSYEAVSAVRMPEQRQMPEVSPENLNPVANKQEAQGLWADGKRMFALNEMDEKLTPITSKAMLDSYPADAIGWMEPEAEQGQMRFTPDKIGFYEIAKEIQKFPISKNKESISNISSIKASLDEFKEMGIRDVPIDVVIDTKNKQYPKYFSGGEEKTLKLAESIKKNGVTSPMILVWDKEIYPYVLEGSTRYDALRVLNSKGESLPETIPALTVIDTSKDLRFMPEGYKSHHDETLLKSAWDGKELNLPRPFKASESLPSLAMRTKWEEKPLVNKGDFDFKQKARVVFGKNKNGEDVTFKFDPNLLNAPSIVDFSKVYSGEQIQYTIADRMSAVDGDMGGSLNPFLKNNDIVIEGPDGRKYVVGWGNNSATVGTKMRRKAKDGAKVLMVYLMGKEAHESNTRTVRLFDTQLENSSMPSHMADIARAYSYIPIKEIKHLSSLKEVERIDGLLKKAKTAKKGSDYINKLKSDKNLAIKEAQKFKVSAYESELAGIFRKVKSSQTRLNNGLGKQSTVDANIKELINFATSAKGKKLIGEIPSQFIYEMTGTFDGRKSAVSQISNLKLYDFDGSALSAATADMETGDKNAIVTAIDLSDNQDFFMLYMGDDPKQMNAMTASEKAAAEKLKQNSNFVIHEAYDTLILSPLEGRRNLNSRMENALDAVPDSFQAVLDDRPSVKAQVGKTDAKGRLILSEDNLLNTVRDQQTVPLIYNPRK